MSSSTSLTVLYILAILNFRYEVKGENFVETIYSPDDETTVKLVINNTIAAKTSFRDFSVIRVSSVIFKDSVESLTSKCQEFRSAMETTFINFGLSKED